jgi:hypothetical protein
MEFSESEINKFPRTLDLATLSIYGLSILSAGLFIFLPLVNLLNPSPWQRWMGTIHSFAAVGAVIVIVYTGHLAFPLLRGVAKILPQVRTLSFWASCLSFLAIASGNWAYMRYCAVEGGAMKWILKNTPLVHILFAQYHEFASLFILPFAVSSTWTLWKYGDSILFKENRPVLTVTCLGLMIMMFFAMGGLVSGLNIARIHTL